MFGKYRSCLIVCRKDKGKEVHSLTYFLPGSHGVPHQFALEIIAKRSDLAMMCTLYSALTKFVVESQLIHLFISLSFVQEKGQHIGRTTRVGGVVVLDADVFVPIAFGTSCSLMKKMCPCSLIRDPDTGVGQRPGTWTITPNHQVHETASNHHNSQPCCPVRRLEACVWLEGTPSAGRQVCAHLILCLGMVLLDLPFNKVEIFPSLLHSTLRVPYCSHLFHHQRWSNRSRYSSNFLVWRSVAYLL